MPSYYHLKLATQWQIEMSTKVFVQKCKVCTKANPEEHWRKVTEYGLKKAKNNNPLFGKTQSKDTIELMRQKALGRIHSEKTKLKMSAVHGNPVNIYEKCYSEGFKLIGSFVSARRAGKFLDISGSTVIRYMNYGEIFKERYKFSSK